MKVKEVMTPKVIRISPEETAAVAARTLTHYNIGILPVCDYGGRLCGLVTDRDLVIRCIAAGKNPAATAVGDVMTRNVVWADGGMDVAVAAHLMGRQQVRRLPVVENGRLCGMVSLADMAEREETAPDAGDALAEISCNLSVRD